jgi:hypothetical protein
MCGCANFKCADGGKKEHAHLHIRTFAHQHIRFFAFVGVVTNKP